MISNAEMTADLREIIAMDGAAQIHLIYQGREIIGTKGNLAMDTIFDRDGGGENSSYDLTATFVAQDFPVLPDGSELVLVNKSQRRILRAKFDDFNVACVLDFTSVVMQ